MSGQTKEESIFLDNEKDRLAKENGYKVIRISDEGNIKDNILNSDLNELFDLSNIDWLEAEEFTYCNLVKMVCSYWNDNPSLTTSDISKIINFCKNTVCKWLKQGSKVGWCNYKTPQQIKYNNTKIACNLKKRNFNLTTGDIANIMNLSRDVVIKYLKYGRELGLCDYSEKEEMVKRGIKQGKQKCKSLIILKNEECLRIYVSLIQLERMSLKDFGIKLIGSKISMVCNNLKPQYKGYQFKYISDLTPEEYIKYDIENKLKELHNQELVQAC